MSRIDKLKAEAERAHKAEKWRARIYKLANRKTNPLSESKFCKAHGINISVFNRNKNGVTIPTDEQIEKVEAALKAERV